MNFQLIENPGEATSGDGLVAYFRQIWTPDIDLIISMVNMLSHFWPLSPYVLQERSSSNRDWCDQSYRVKDFYYWAENQAMSNLVVFVALRALTNN